eukprot:EC798871.1.p5 GENE.EC798871.1~~EC798871.1.p5  ORF type:complete len:71 (+),score=14.10 EC798871.1:388-600(+)
MSESTGTADGWYRGGDNSDMEIDLTPLESPIPPRRPDIVPPLGGSRRRSSAAASSGSHHGHRRSQSALDK